VDSACIPFSLRRKPSPPGTRLCRADSDWLKEAVYGIPELYSPKLHPPLVANPVALPRAYRPASSHGIRLHRRGLQRYLRLQVRPSGAGKDPRRDLMSCREFRRRGVLRAPPRAEILDHTSRRSRRGSLPAPLAPDLQWQITLESAAMQPDSVRGRRARITLVASNRIGDQAADAIGPSRVQEFRKRLP